MNKLFKGAIASAAGVALLLGGAGTFALWQDATRVGTNAVIDAGHLRFGEVPDGGTWTLDGDDVPDITKVRLVPGDVLTYTLNGIEIIAHGDHLAAEFGFIWDGAAAEDNDGDTSIGGNGNPMTAATASGDLLGALDIAYAVKLNNATIDGVPSDDGHAVTVQIPGGTSMDPKDVDIVVTITFDPDTPDQVGMGGIVNLQGFQLTLQQVPTLGQVD